MTLPYRPHTLQWPLTPSALDDLNETLENVYTELRKLADGGGFPDGTTGDLIYFTNGSWAALPIGSAGQVLQVSGGLPAWGTSAAGGVSQASILTRVFIRG